MLSVHLPMLPFCNVFVSLLRLPLCRLTRFPTNSTRCHALSRIFCPHIACLSSHVGPGGACFLTFWSWRGVSEWVWSRFSSLTRFPMNSTRCHAFSRVFCPHVARLSSRFGPGGPCFLTFWSWRGVSEWVRSRFSSSEQLLRRTRKIK